MEEMSSLDMYFVTKELKDLVGGKIQKIYQRDRTFRIRIYANGENHELMLSPGKIYTTEFDRKGPMRPPNFCMFLRKHLRNERVTKIKQHKFDRIFEIHTKEAILICEVFGKGNFILIKSNGQIIQPLEVQRWSERELISKKMYKYPPAGINPRTITRSHFEDTINEDREIVRKMARVFNLGGRWSEELCLRADIDKNKEGNKLTGKEKTRLYNQLKQLFKTPLEPRVIKEDGHIVGAAPFSMKKYEGMEYQVYDTYNQALDHYFSKRESQKIEKEGKKTKEKKISKLDRISEEQKKAIEKWKKIRKESKEKADLIYENYSLVDDILSGLQKAMDSDLSWKEVKKRINSEDSPQSRAIEKIDENNGLIIINLDGTSIKIDFRVSIEENAEEFYQEMKKADRKLERASEEMEQTESKKEKVEEKDVKEFADSDKMRAKPTEKIDIKEESGWYKQYRWFKTSDGFLVVAGKSAKQNEELIKKHTKQEDIILHTDMPGSPFTVIKAEGENISPTAIKEAAEFGASFSKAWKRNYGAVDIYWVRLDQVSKDAPSGENIGKGSFMIKGRKNYLKKTELKISIGIKLDRDKNEIRILNGSTQSVRNNATYFVTLNPGDIDRNTLAKKIKNKLGEKAKPEDQRYIEKVPTEKIKPLIPAGGGMIMG